MEQGNVPMKRVGTISLRSPKKATITGSASFAATVTRSATGRLTLRDNDDPAKLYHVSLKNWSDFSAGDVVDVVRGYVSMPDDPDDVRPFVTVRKRGE